MIVKNFNNTPKELITFIKELQNQETIQQESIITNLS